ncbi:AfsR/SARP family transcriptional regulator [Actinoplanes sp. Pm04-4]|uniref:AfsR/SARP family transcriptional regulator n=1 Tax=Paractinoplanes pyxinae TaxID=2997416 RepID=A0ABT4BDB1_9ACTN|nr:AfsR/SARP family transcriptional regulator [Actinoplanes pyxinae]MCY1143580.1 AfsR/SARP family transcriptional regulator [Actinoplanes pyxinae]
MTAATLSFGILGPVELRSRERRLELTSTKQQALLGAGLLNANTVVSAGRLVDAIWGERPPPSATALVQTYVSALRRIMVPLAPDGPSPIVTRAPGYVVRVADGELDLHAFELLSAEGERAAAGGDHRRAAALFREALGHWRGPAFDGLDTPLFRAAAARLDEARLAVLERRIDADTHVGPTGGLVAELTELVAAHPLRERLRGSLMRSLYQLGRQAEALAVFQEGYAVLREELGIEPGPELRVLHHKILDADPALMTAAPPASPAPAVPAGDPPRQLPPPPPQFVGRTAETVELGPDDRPSLTVISGPPGVGKSALALTVAGAARDLFPDGQLFVPVRAYGPGRPTAVADALAMLLRSLGVPARLPETVDELAALLRTTLIGRRVLIVLDDVGGATEVRPFLSPHPGTAVLVTSRPRLPSLDVTRAVHLGPLPPADALRLLAGSVGADRVAAEPGAAADVVRVCEGLPLALRAAGARLAGRPRWRLADLARRVLDDQRRLDELAAGDLDVRTSIDGSYRRLGEPEAELFRRLGRLSGPEFSAEAVNRLIGSPVAYAERIADRLVEAQLLDHADADGDEQHYKMSVLTFLFAREVSL